MRTAETGILWRVAVTRMPTKWGMFSAIGFETPGLERGPRAETALAIVLGELTSDCAPHCCASVRQCFTGEVLGSLRCDCHGQLEMAMKVIATEGRGLVIYEYQEGRGIGLMAKLQAYELQDVGIDTGRVQSHALGFKGDCRDFSLQAAILHDLGVERVRPSQQIIPARLSSWPIAALKLWRGFPARSCTELRTLSPTCRPKKKKKWKSRTEPSPEQKDAESSHFGAREQHF